MYVCVCNAVTEREVRNTIKNGATTMRQLRSELKVATSCGTCTEGIEQFLEDVLNREAASTLSAWWGCQKS